MKLEDLSVGPRADGVGVGIATTPVINQSVTVDENGEDPLHSPSPMRQ